MSTMRNPASRSPPADAGQEHLGLEVDADATREMVGVYLAGNSG